MSINQLLIEGARQNNLKNISLNLPHNALIVVTGVSGSGKSSLAFDTIYAEGQWRFIESLSPYARLYIEKLARPDVDEIKNLRPAIALEQRNSVKTSRSTVGTITEVYDYLRLLTAKIGSPHCPGCGKELRRWSPSAVVQHLLANFQNERALIIFIARESTKNLQGKGFHRFREVEENPGLIEVILDRLVIRDEPRLSDSIEMAWTEGKGKIIVDIVGRGKSGFSSNLVCDSCNIELPEPHPLLFSFNHPVGVCPICKGFGDTLHYSEDKVITDPTKSLKDHAITPWSKPSYEWWYEQMLRGAEKSGIPLDVPYKELSDQDRQRIFEGNKNFLGINDFFKALEEKKYKLHVRVFLSKYRRAVTCEACKGSRLRSEALAFRVAGQTIHDLSKMTLSRLFDLFETLSLSQYEESVSEEVLRQIRLKLTFLNRVGLGYLTGDRAAKTLSGGEAQRIKLSNQLASKLTGTLYVLDEPTIGLHAADVFTIVTIMKELARIGNTLVVVEHDSSVIRVADWVVEIGPESGSSGGRIMFSGPYDYFMKQDSLTAQYLRKSESIPEKPKRRKGKGILSVTGASGHNLKHIDVDFPLGTLICVTGVSGSGKSTLVNDTIYYALTEKLHEPPENPATFGTIYGVEKLKGVQIIDQSPVGKSPRSNPVTYVKAFDSIRKLFASLPEAVYANFGPGHFSFNTEEGRCDLCRGDGVQKLEMYFFEDIYIPCEQCKGKRFKDEILQIKYQGKNIYDILELTVDEAMVFFQKVAAIAKRLKILDAVGLGYLKLGQPLNTLSGGETQRLKICAELGISPKKQYLYILDEPSVGLHNHDIKKLLAVIDNLVDAGNTVVIVEHHLDIIRYADWIVDLGPGGGEKGGHLVACGTPEKIMETPNSVTGKMLRQYLEKL